jgi:hypothetical protein
MDNKLNLNFSAEFLLLSEALITETTAQDLVQ